jgi:hypothetical protein
MMTDSEIEFTPEQQKLIEERTEAKFDKIKDDLKYELDDSTDKVEGQNFVVVSFAGTDCKPACDDIAIKVWGAFDTNEQAMEHCIKIGRLEENRNYNIFVMGMYNWAICPPDLSKIGQVVYHEEKLQNIINEHNKQSIRSKEVFDLRREVTLFKPDRNLDKLDESYVNVGKSDPEKIVFEQQTTQS